MSFSIFIFELLAVADSWARPTAPDTRRRTSRRLSSSQGSATGPEAPAGKPYSSLYEYARPRRIKGAAGLLLVTTKNRKEIQSKTRDVPLAIKSIPVFSSCR